jgi:PPOX class probable F420-dependent enzyme
MKTTDAQLMRRRVAGARVARLATAGPDGRPHVVPITFATRDDALFFAVDSKPKNTTRLRRLRNIEANPHVSVLIDHYDEDWTKLWWVRIDGRAVVVHDGAAFDEAIALLTERYPQYRSQTPVGPAVMVTIERMSGWSAS